MLDEFSKMFTEADSFYYSPTFDITNSLQRQFKLTQNPKTSSGETKAQPELWEMADNRFFWNYWMIRSLIEDANKVGFVTKI